MLDRFFGRRRRPGPADPLHPLRPADAAGEPLMPSPPAGRAAGDFVAPQPPRRSRPGDLMPSPAPSPAGGLSLPEVPARVWHDNRRLAEHLRTTGDDGLVPTLIADVLATGGAAGFVNSRDLIHQVAAHDPARAASLLDKAAAKLPADKRPLADALGAGRDPHPQLLGLQTVAGEGTAAARPDVAPREVAASARPAATTPPEADVVSPAAPAPAKPPASSPAAMMPVPDYRKEVFDQDRKAWPEMYGSVSHLPNLGPSELRSYMEVFAAEGGRRVDPKSGAVAGILPGTLDDLIDRGYVHGIPKGTPPANLTSDQRARVYRGYTDAGLRTVGGHAALEKLDPLTASVLGDAIVRHGPNGGTALLQQAINQVSPGAVEEDGALGPKTFGAIRRLSADPKRRRAFLAVLADQRAETVKNSPNAKGERIRFDHFRFGNSR